MYDLMLIVLLGILTFFDPEVKRTNPETGAVIYGQHVEGFERKVRRTRVERRVC